MKKIRMFASKMTVLIPVILTFIVSSCFQKEDLPSANLPTEENYSGEELFRGIFFLQGRVAQELNGLQQNLEQIEATMSLDENSRISYGEFSDEIINEINEIDPEFFEKFHTQLKSDNYYVIELALDNSRNMIMAAGLKSDKYSGLFKLVQETKNKGIDFRSQFGHLDFTNDVDVAQFKNEMKDVYQIDLDDEKYQVACVPAIAVCYAIAAAVSIAAVAYTALAGVQAVAVFAYYVYSEVKFWGSQSIQDDDIMQKALINEIANIY